MTVPDRLHLGAAYYPEHWTEDHWPEDVRLMRAAGFTVARLSEFAWSTLETAPGVFNFDWLDRAITLLAENGLATILGTPTASPPAWLVQQSPEMLAVDEHGRPVQFGNRAHYCVNAPAFHAATRRIVQALAERFGPNPHVLGWQIDNEYHRLCYCSRCQAGLQQMLAEQYGTLENLNRRWSTAYTSQTYSTWGQIPLPIGFHNPGLMLAHKHFLTQGYRRFQRLQVETLRPHLRPGVWITHNFMNFMRWFDGYDPYPLMDDLDLAALDWYMYLDHNDYAESAAVYDLTRGFKRQNFWILETLPGSVNWKSINNTLDKGEGRALAWQAIAHGAESIVYWQWRASLNGQEQYHGTLVDQANRPRPFYYEAQQLGREFERVSSLLNGSAPQSRAAILIDFDSRWSLQWQPHHRDFSYASHLMHYYRALIARNVAVDILPAKGVIPAQLARYRLVITPALHLVPEGLGPLLEQYVHKGGHLVITLRCGMKDAHNALLPQRPPGPLTTLAGVEVEEYYALLEPVPIQGNWFAGTAQIWGERLQPMGDTPPEIIARFHGHSWLKGYPAVTVQGRGQGLAYYVGTYLDDGSQQTFVDRVIASAGLRGFDAPPGVEVRARTTPGGEDLTFIINHTAHPVNVNLPWPAFDHLAEASVEGRLALAPYGVALLTRIAPMSPGASRA